tara:strand:- start:41 stop:868 length:828 start_codon:yes stop_codon:yes gene_type:complete
MAQAITTQLPHSGTTHRRFQMEPNTNTVPVNVISDTFNTAQAVLENHEQRIGKIEKAHDSECPQMIAAAQQAAMDAVGDISGMAKEVAKDVKAEDVAEHVCVSDVADYMDVCEVAENICCGEVANNIDMSTLADYMDTDHIIERASENIDFYSLAQCIDNHDLASEFDTCSIADEIDLEDVADNINMIELANTITENNASELGDGLLGAMMDAFSERNTLRDEIRELRRVHENDKDRLIHEIDFLKAALNTAEAKLKKTDLVVDDAAPTPEANNG